LDEAERSLLSSSAGRGVEIAIANGDLIVILLLAMMPFTMVVVRVVSDEVDGGIYGRRSNVPTLLLSSSMSSVVSALFHFSFHLTFHLSFHFVSVALTRL